MNPRYWLIALAVVALHGALIAVMARFEPARPPAPVQMTMVALAAPEPVPPRVEPAEPPPAPPPPAPPPPAPPPPAPPPPAPPPPAPPPPAPPPPAPPPPAPPPPAPPPPRPADARPKPPPSPVRAAQPTPPVVAPQESSAPAVLASASEPAPQETAPEQPERATAPPPLIPPVPAALSGSTATASSPPTAASTRQTGPRVDANWSGNTPPPYPPGARRLREEGDVRLSVHIDEHGHVTEVRVALSSGSPRLDAAAIETVKKWRFTPASIDGQPAAGWYHDWLWSFRIDQ